MKRLAWIGMALAVSACGGGADEGASPSPGMSPGYGSAVASPATTGTMPMGATSGEFAAEVVTVDQSAGTITVRESAVGGTAAGTAAAGTSSTLTVDQGARSMLADVRSGDQVTITCSMSGGMGTTGTDATGTAGTGTTGTTGTGTAGTGTTGTGTTGMGGAGTTGTGTTGVAGNMLSNCTTVTAVRKAAGANS